MKKTLICLLAAIGVTLASCAGSSKEKTQDSTTMKQEDTKTLVAYFSATGTTKSVAEKIAAATNGKLVEIAADPAYTPAELDWHDNQSRSSVLMADSTARPAIKDVTEDLSGYDVIYLGYPIWWDLAPREVETFLDKYDFSGKKVIPFATSGGSTTDNSVAKLKKSYPKHIWQSGKLLNNPTDKDIADFVK